MPPCPEVAPNYEGMVVGYSRMDRDEYETTFSNRWMAPYGDRHLESMDLCMSTFHHEHNDVRPALMEKLEEWIEANDAELEATKKSPDSGIEQYGTTIRDQDRRKRDMAVWKWHATVDEDEHSSVAVPL